MNTTKTIFHYGLIAVVVGAGLSLFTTAYADGGRSALGPLIRKGAVARSTSPRIRIPQNALSGSRSRGQGSSFLQGLSRSGGNSGFSNRQGSTNGLNNWYPGMFLEQLGGGGFGGPFGGPFGSPYDRHEKSDAHEYADAIRDVGIANAVVGLVGVIANSQPTYREPVYREPVYRETQPTQRYAREKVILKEGYYEDYKVWVPEQYDSGSRDKILGHYEMRQRWVPEVYGFRDVQVQE